MNKPKYDKDLLKFFAEQIVDEDEVDLLRKILEDVDETIIIEEFIQSKEDHTDD